jgi:hypothetical protein
MTRAPVTGRCLAGVGGDTGVVMAVVVVVVVVVDGGVGEGGGKGGKGGEEFAVVIFDCEVPRGRPLRKEPRMVVSM